MAKDLQKLIAGAQEELAATRKKNIELTLKNQELKFELKRWKGDSPSVSTSLR